MANFVFNIAKGKAGQYFQNVEDNSPAGCCIRVIPIEASGVEADDTLNNYATVSALLAGTTNEQTTMGRKQVLAAGLTLSVDNTGNLLKVDMADQTWTGATGNAISDLLIAYDPTGASADTALIPLTFHDFSVTPDGSDITADVNTTNGIYQAT